MTNRLREIRKAVSAYANRLYLEAAAVDFAMEYARAATAENPKADFQIQACSFLTCHFQSTTVKHPDGRLESPRVRVMQARITSYWIGQVKAIGSRSNLDEQQGVLSNCLRTMDGDDVSSIAEVCRFYAPGYFGNLSNYPHDFLTSQMAVIANIDWRAVAIRVLEQWHEIQPRVDARNRRRCQRLKARKLVSA